MNKMDKMDKKDRDKKDSQPNEPVAPLSRRSVLKNGAAAIGGAATVLGGGLGGGLAARAATPLRQTNVGRPFRGLVRRGTGVRVEDLRLLPIQPREVVVRTEASAACYTIVRQVLGTNNTNQASIPNHSGVGIVEEVGPMVKRVQVGDRVVVPGTPQCGQCYHCLQGRSDWCQFLSTAPPHPVAEMLDGTEVFESGALGGLSEIMVVAEEYLCPVFTDVPPAELSLLGDTIGTGLAAGRNLVAIRPGWDVVVLGAGPVGLGAIQSARIASAAQIIVVEPIAYRRQVALDLGATSVLDPNAEGDRLVETIRSMCEGPTGRRFAGGRAWNDALFAVPRGPDVTIEAVGGDQYAPAVEVGPDPTGILPLQQAFEFTRSGGHIVTLGFGQQGNVEFPAWAFANRGRTFHAGQQGGLNMLRDIPRYVRLIEQGSIDTASVVTATYAIDQARDAVQAVADRTTVAAVVVFE
jgi:S-(hydroxymethyl)glutathione dehydrogenase/alcohol dehydrogenase